MVKESFLFCLALCFIIGLNSCNPSRKVPSEVLAAEKLIIDEEVAVDANFPDPTLINGHDGYYYAYATNTEIDGKTIHIQVARSHDLSDWEVVGDALPQRPSWADKDFWAPHVLYDSTNRTYYLYYSGESIDKNIGKCMGVATSKDPEGPFEDMGKPLLCGETFVEIDPMAFDDPATGKKLLYWGSGHEAIKVQELDDSRMDFKPESKPIELIDVIGDDHPDNYQKLVEGVWVHFHEGNYFLFYSGDNCCGNSAHYAVMVARSDKATGPFETLAEATGSKNSVILEKNGKWLAPGHNSIIVDDRGQEWIAYHAIDTVHKEKGRVMRLDKVNWVNGWPRVLVQEKP
jgi:arabinan endo-1,5-alpha-L-arabinosidase